MESVCIIYVCKCMCTFVFMPGSAHSMTHIWTKSRRIAVWLADSLNLKFINIFCKYLLQLHTKSMNMFDSFESVMVFL